MLSGWLQSGKDTVAEILVKDLGFTRFAFADILKDYVALNYDIPRYLMDSTNGKDTIIKNKSVRRHLIDIGQDKRSHDPLYWVKPVCKQIQSSNCDRVVITDWRLPNERDEICRVFGIENVVTARIQRWSKPPLVDETEIALDNFNFDIIIDNTKTIEFLVTVVHSNFINFK